MDPDELKKMQEAQGGETDPMKALQNLMTGGTSKKKSNNNKDDDDEDD